MFRILYSFILFQKYICKCINVNEVKLDLEENPVCMIRKTHNIDAVYSMSHFALPIFKFKKGIPVSFLKKKSYNQSLTESNKDICFFSRETTKIISQVP